MLFEANMKWALQSYWYPLLKQRSIWDNHQKELHVNVKRQVSTKFNQMSWKKDLQTFFRRRFFFVQNCTFFWRVQHSTFLDEDSYLRIWLSNWHFTKLLSCGFVRSSLRIKSLTKNASFNCYIFLEFKAILVFHDRSSLSVGCEFSIAGLMTGTISSSQI